MGWYLTRCRALEGMMANLSSVLAQAAADHGERPAVRLDDLVLNYSQLRDAAGPMNPLPSNTLASEGSLVPVQLDPHGGWRMQSIRLSVC